MPAIVAEEIEIRQIRGMFSADEVGWIAAEAETQAVLFGDEFGKLSEAHSNCASLGLLVAHPRLKSAVENALSGPVSLRDTAFWRSWDGQSMLLPEGDGVVALVFLGWRGAVMFGETVLRSDLGAVAILDRRDIAKLHAIEATGPLLAIGYADDGAPVEFMSDNCLWPAAWCVAG